MNPQDKAMGLLIISCLMFLFIGFIVGFAAGAGQALKWKRDQGQ